MRPLLRLLRLPTVFTAIADVLMGYLMTRDTLWPAGQFVLLLSASSSLYLGGMVFNDVFDRDRDALQRSQRPLPAGEISLRTAVLTGIVLVVAGNLLAALAGFTCWCVAVSLTAAVFLYDKVLKTTTLAPVAMGACRFLNVLLAASVPGSWSSLWGHPQLLAAAGLGVYTTGLTWFARREAGDSRRPVLLTATAVTLAGPTIHGWLIMTGPAAVSQPAGVALLLAVVAIVILRRNLMAVANPEPATVQAGVRTMLLSFVMIDATLILFKTGSVRYALVTVSLLVPAMILRRWIPLT